MNRSIRTPSKRCPYQGGEEDRSIEPQTVTDPKVECGLELYLNLVPKSLRPVHIKHRRSHTLITVRTHLGQRLLGLPLGPGRCSLVDLCAIFSFLYLKIKKFKNICWFGNISKMGACRPLARRQDPSINFFYR